MSVALTIALALYLDAPPELLRPILVGVERELPGIQVVERSSPDVLAVRIAALAEQGFTLETSLGDRVLDQRELGADLDAAVRLAVLLIVERLRDLPAEPPSVQTATTAATRTATTTVTPPLPPRSPEQKWFHLEFALDLDAWINPLSPRTGLSAAFFVRNIDPLLAGLRVRGAALCCTILGDGVEGDVRSFAVFLEARYSVRAGIAVFASGGFSYEHVSARAAPGVYQGPSALEGVDELTAIGRAGLLFEPALSDALNLAILLGIEGFAGSLWVSSPAPYSNGRDPIDRGSVAPFLAAGVGFDL